MKIGMRERFYDIISLILFVGFLVLVLQIARPLTSIHWERILGSYKYILDGFKITWIASLTAFAASIVPGIILALGRMSTVRYISYPAALIIEIFRTIPELLIIFWVFFIIPFITGDTLPPIVAGVLALFGINTAYLAEIIRAGIRSVPIGIKSAATASGLTSFQVMIYIVLPLAVRNMLPALVTQLIYIFKVSSLLYVIGITELFRAITIVNNREFAPFAAYISAAVVYFVSNYILSIISNKLEAVL
jgi:His/Glu/Gln/Arg/opine family amino acid ABC transporter permease subunit